MEARDHILAAGTRPAQSRWFRRCDAERQVATRVPGPVGAACVAGARQPRPGRRATAAAGAAENATMNERDSPIAAPAMRAFDRIDRRITELMARSGVPLLRIALGVVFLWFGALKLVPGLSPAETLAARTIEALSFGLVSPSVSVPALAVWECMIGLGLLTGIAIRATLLLLFVQMLGTLTPLVIFPAETFVRFPFAPTLEGQYIIKNAVLIAGAIVVGATVRGGGLVPEPVDEAGASPSA
jgi:uncharacterized membrane protein YphA (DoxX/SURF4 family)